MPSIEEVNLAEERDATDLAEAYSLLMARWQAGARDEETILRLLFFCWYSNVEPPYLTHLPDASHNFMPIFEEAGGDEKATPLILLAVMTDIFPWAVGDEGLWTARSKRLIAKAKARQPGISSGSFHGLGEAGRYFRHVLSEGYYDQVLKDGIEP